ncbi:glycosyl hydrolase family 8 [Rehaibacterium terrae]|jgi:hypothetical protein|uniref:cellulase n=1 Tax=Rehaibacterium terrae TaxID=1341696 RepID=A0A7W8DEU3_9GAMM|nr:glycosyl hydrolase family 8 [Rehaibacterium terrae]MBB5015709.1 endoglucanase [Rehaibacterium terrae]
MTPLPPHARPTARTYARLAAWQWLVLALLLPLHGGCGKDPAPTSAPVTPSGASAPLMPAPFPGTEWQAYQSAFLSPEGRIIDTGKDGISHSEGQGYGMLLALAADDLDTFERIWNWTREHLQREDHLFGWKWEPGQTPGVSDWNNASDGDLLIAWALAEGGARWKRDAWREAAAAIARQLRENMLRDSDIGPLLIPGQSGFEHEDHILLNPSYWVFPAFTALDRVDPDPAWSALAASGQRLLALTRYGPAGVPPDWVRLHPDGRLSLPEEAERRRFGYEAPRVPLYLCWDGQRDRQILHAFLRAWPDDAAPAWVDLHNGDRAAHSLTLTQRAIRQLVLACDGQQADTAIEISADDYYGSSLSLLARVALARGGDPR